MLGEGEQLEISGEGRNSDDCLLFQKVKNREEKNWQNAKSSKNFKLCELEGVKGWEAEILEGRLD